VSNVNWSQLTPWTGSIDIANDLVAVWKAGNNTLYKATPNQLANLTSQWVGQTDTQTLSNKTLNNTNAATLKAGNWTLQDGSDTTKQLQWSLSGITTGNTRTLTMPDASGTLVLTAATQTLTNKTLTGPTINGGTLDNATVTVDTVAGHTSSTTGTIYGISVTSGTIGSAALASNAVTSSAIATNAVTAPKLSTSAIYLGATTITANMTATSAAFAATSPTMILSVTVPSGGRNMQITCFGPAISTSAAANYAFAAVYDTTAGAIGSGASMVGTARYVSTTGGYASGLYITGVVSAPSAGVHTYQLALASGGGGTTTVNADSGGTGTSTAAFGPAILMATLI
jgi:hypothetical protein